MLFLSFQITQTPTNQIKCIKAHCFLEIPAELPNWMKWSEITNGSTKDKPNKLCTRTQRWLNILQDKNIWLAVSMWLHPLAQNFVLWGIMYRLNKSLVDSLIRRSRQAYKETFKGTSLFQMRSKTTIKWDGSRPMSNWYAPRTEYPSTGSNCQHHWSTIVTYKCTLSSKTLHSSTISSSQASNRRLHFQVSPSTPHPKENISNTVNQGLSDKSNNLLKWYLSLNSLNHIFIQKMVYAPLPTLYLISSSNHLPTAKPSPLQIRTNSFHQTDPSLQPSSPPPPNPSLYTKSCRQHPEPQPPYICHHPPTSFL